MKMKKIIIVEDVDFGIISAVEDEHDLIPALIADDYLNGDYTATYDPDAREWLTVEQVYGKEWATVLAAKPLADLRKIFEQTLYFTEMWLYERG